MRSIIIVASSLLLGAYSMPLLVSKDVVNVLSARSPSRPYLKAWTLPEEDSAVEKREAKYLQAWTLPEVDSTVEKREAKYLQAWTLPEEGKAVH